MPRDNSVNKKANIYATHTTLGVKNMLSINCYCQQFMFDCLLSNSFIHKSHISSCSFSARSLLYFNGSSVNAIGIFARRSRIISAPGQFKSCNHSNRKERYGTNSSSDLSAITFAHDSHTDLLFPLGRKGCK